MGNYFFSSTDVQSFVDAKLFGGAPLSSFITMPAEELRALGGVHSTVVWVSIPLMILAGIATHLTSRRSVGRQSAEAASQQQTAIMNKLMLWVFPLFVVVGGPFFPVAILLYWLSNNGWTLVQQHYLFANMAKQEEAKRADAVERRSATAPKVGAKPVSTKKGRAVTAAPAVDLDKTTAMTDGEDGVADAPATPAKAARSGASTSARTGGSSRSASGPGGRAKPTSSSARGPRKKR